MMGLIDDDWDDDDREGIPWHMGFEDGMFGTLLSLNPFPPDSEAWFSYIAGWEEGRGCS